MLLDALEIFSFYKIVRQIGDIAILMAMEVRQCAEADWRIVKMQY